LNGSQTLYSVDPAAQAGYELQQFMNEKGVNPLKNMIVPLVQVFPFCGA